MSFSSETESRRCLEAQPWAWAAASSYSVTIATVRCSKAVAIALACIDRNYRIHYLLRCSVRQRAYLERIEASSISAGSLHRTNIPCRWNCTCWHYSIAAG